MNKDTNSTTVSATLDYFLIDMWKVKDQRVAELPLIGSGPWFMLIFMTIYLVIISRLNNQMKHRPAYFLRPFQIVYYGFMFGIHGVAVPVVLALARSPINTFLCNMNGSVATDLRATMFIYAGLLYLFVKLTTCLDLMILFWIKEHRKVTTALLMETILGPFILYGEMKYYPGGIIYFPIATDCAINTIKYGLSTRSCAGEELKPIENWEHKVHLLKVLQYCVCTLHSLYSMTIENCDCPLGLRYFLLTLHIFLAIVYIFNDTPLNSTTKSSSLSSSSSPSSTLMTNRVTRSQTKSSNGSSSLSTESATTAIRRNTVKAS